MQEIRTKKGGNQKKQEIRKCRKLEKVGNQQRRLKKKINPSKDQQK